MTLAGADRRGFISSASLGESVVSSGEKAAEMRASVGFSRVLEAPYEEKFALEVTISPPTHSILSAHTTAQIRPPAPATLDTPSCGCSETLPQPHRRRCLCVRPAVTSILVPGARRTSAPLHPHFPTSAVDRAPCSGACAFIACSL